MSESLIQRKRKTKDPCEGCGLRPDLCLCSLIPGLDLKTRLCLVIHARELKRTTNTGTLACRALRNSVVKVRGVQGDTLDLSDQLNLGYHSLLLFPGAGSQELTPEFVAKCRRPIQLFVPDGNWRQASKVHGRQPELADLPRVMLKIPNLAKFHLRAESSPYGMSTLQAIAYAMGLIEGPEVENSLMQLYQVKLERTMQSRGYSERASEEDDSDSNRALQVSLSRGNLYRSPVCTRLGSLLSGKATVKLLISYLFSCEGVFMQEVSSPARQGLILVCEKCGRSGKADENPAIELQKELKSRGKDEFGKKEIRAVQVSCMDLCPKGKIAVCVVPTGSKPQYFEVPMDDQKETVNQIFNLFRGKK